VSTRQTARGYKTCATPALGQSRERSVLGKVHFVMHSCNSVLLKSVTSLRITLLAW
jgi:hypothetical protein